MQIDPEGKWHHGPSLGAEWTWLAVASLVVVLRYISRYIRLGGLKNFQAEDWLMLPTYALYANMMVFIHVQARHNKTNVLPETGTAGMSQEELEERKFGAIVTFVVEESMVFLQLFSKLCMSMMFLRITAGLKRAFWVKASLIYIVVTWAITEFCWLVVWCRPMTGYFQVSDHISRQCQTAQHHLIMSYTFNITGDLLLLVVPVAMLLQTHLPRKQKLMITGIFSCGVFVIIAATLSRYYTFAKPTSIGWIYWYIREGGTIIIVCNIPHLYALLRLIFHLEAMGNVFGKISRRAGSHSYPSYESEKHRKSIKATIKSAVSTKQERSESTDNIAHVEAGIPLEIWQRKDYAVHTVDAAQVPWDATDPQRALEIQSGAKDTVTVTACPKTGGHGNCPSF